MTEEGAESELAFRTETSCIACTTTYATCPPGYTGLLDGDRAPAGLLKSIMTLINHLHISLQLWVVLASPMHHQWR